MDRRWRNRRNDERPQGDEVPPELKELADEAPTFNPPRRKKQRRRQIDPTTCERDYNEEEIRFMRAMDDYKRDSGRMFPTCSEILEVIRGLGYTKLTDEEKQIVDSLQQMVQDLPDEIQDSFDSTAEAESVEEGMEDSLA